MEAAHRLRPRCQVEWLRHAYAFASGPPPQRRRSHSWRRRTGGGSVTPQRRRHGLWRGCIQRSGVVRKRDGKSCRINANRWCLESVKVRGSCGIDQSALFYIRIRLSSTPTALYVTVDRLTHFTTRQLPSANSLCLCLRSISRRVRCDLYHRSGCARSLTHCTCTHSHGPRWLPLMRLPQVR